MKMRLSQLRRIIKEEVAHSLAESGGYNDVPDVDNRPANRGDRVSVADDVILALSKASLTPDDLRVALDAALLKGIVDELQADEINALLRDYR